MRALVAGAGIAGLAAAHNLARRGWRVTVFEKSPGPRDSGYMIDFTGSGYDAAERMGLIEALRAKGYTIESVAFVDADDRVRARMRFKAALAAVGGRWIPIMRSDLEGTLFETLPDGVEVRYDAEVRGFDNRANGVAVELADGGSEEGDVLIGADGVHSRVRRALFGAEAGFARYLGFHVAAFLFEDAGIRNRLGNDFRMLSVPNRQVGAYGLRDGRLASFFVHPSDDPARPASVADALAEVYGDLGWYLPEMLAAARRTDDIYYDQLHQIVLDDWHRGRVVLLGDAAYAVTLLAGSGAALAMGGAWVLAELLDSGGDIDAALAALRPRLAADIAEKQRAGRQMARWFVPRSGLELAVRHGFINLVSLPGLNGLLGSALAPSTKSVIRF